MRLKLGTDAWFPDTSKEIGILGFSLSPSELPRGEAKSIFSDGFFQNNIGAPSRSEKYTFQVLQPNPAVWISASLFDSEMPGGPGGGGVGVGVGGGGYVGLLGKRVFAALRGSSWKWLSN